MKIKMKVDVESEVKFLKAECGVRYWEDAEVNGVEDDDNNPRMPFKVGDTWSPVIDLDTGTIVDWPAGTTASTHYKVCDDGRYSLLDENKAEVVSIDGYVPKIMCPGDNGYGDYVIMSIGADGKIEGWHPDLSAFEEGAR
jgi:hypothetical protein